MKKLILTFVLSIIHLSLSTMQTTQKTINLIVGEDTFEVPQSIAMEAETLKHMAEDLGLAGDLPLSAQIDPKTMGQVAQIMWSYSHHKDLKGKALLDAIEKDISNQNLPWVDILRAFNYLDFSVGLSLAARAIARNAALSKEFMANAALKDLRPLVAKYYYLLNQKNLAGVDEKSYGFSIQEYLDYQPQLIASKRAGNQLLLEGMRLQSLDGLADIPNIVTLQVLRLGGNQLRILPLGIFNGLATLQELFLNDNQLSILPAGIFNGLASLINLNISFNKLNALPAGIFNGLISLQQLYLSFNQLSALPQGFFNGLANLQRLGLGNNQLSTLPAWTFDGLAALRDLYLGSNQLRALPAGIFKGLTNLQKLELDNNQLSKETKEELRATLVSLPDLRFSF